MIRFAAVADLQYGDLDETIGRTYRDSIQKFLISAGEISRADIEFAMNFGDAWQSDWSNALAVRELFHVSEKYAGITWRHVLGNHDFHVEKDKKSEVYGLLGLEKPGYYDFLVVDPEDAKNRWRFVVLNGNEISEYASETKEERERAKAERERWRRTDADNKLPAEWNGSLSQTQLDWVERTLSEADANGENVAVCSHFPLYAQSKTLDSPRTKLASLVNLDVFYFRLGISTWNGSDLLEILDRHACVKAYLAGHLHEGSYGVRNNVAHVTFKGVVETPKNCYAFVELHKNAIVVDGRLAQPSYRHEFE